MQTNKPTATSVAGVDVRAVYAEGDGYFGIAKNSAALHVAAWRAQHETVQLLIERGAPVDVRDGSRRTPLALACVRAWTCIGPPDAPRSRFGRCSRPALL